MIILKGIVGEEITLQDVIAATMADKSDVKKYMINSVGGNAMEGIKIYEYLKSLPNKIIVEARGSCCSAATPIFLAGDERVLSCDIMIHNPYIQVEGDSETLKEYSEVIETIEEAYKAVYVAETGIPDSTISELMKRETYIKPKEALKMGFATSVGKNVQTINKKALAFVKPNLNKSSKMAKSKISSKLKSAIDRAKAKIDEKAKALEYTTEDGTLLIVEKVEGEPKVGDQAQPDGVHLVENIGIIVVEDGVIASISDGSAEEGLDNEEIVELIDELVDEIEDKQEEISELVEEVKELTEELADAKEKSKKPEDVVILNYVKAMGGLTVLKEIAKGVKGEYKPTVKRDRTRKGEEATAKKDDSYSPGVNKKLADLRAKAANKKD